LKSIIPFLFALKGRDAGNARIVNHLIVVERYFGVDYRMVMQVAMKNGIKPFSMRTTIEAYLLDRLVVPEIGGVGKYGQECGDVVKKKATPDLNVKLVSVKSCRGCPIM
jgi:hypothetical protein